MRCLEAGRRSNCIDDWPPRPFVIKEIGPTRSFSSATNVVSLPTTPVTIPAFSTQPLLTEIVRAPQFYRAEERHQRYLEKRSYAALA